MGDTPLWFGEWGLPTQFNATDEFLSKWADAQKLAYSEGAGWIVSDLHVVNDLQNLTSLLVLEFQGRDL